MKGKAYLEILSDFTNKSLEWEFANKQFSGFLITTDFTKSDSSGPESMGLLHTTSGGLHKKKVKQKTKTKRKQSYKTYSSFTS